MPLEFILQNLLYSASKALTKGSRRKHDQRKTS